MGGTVGGAAGTSIIGVSNLPPASLTVKSSIPGLARF